MRDRRSTLLGDHFSLIGFSDQAGLALAIAAAGLATLPLGHAYNCANDDRVFTTGLDSERRDQGYSLPARGREFDRRTFLADPIAFRDFGGSETQSGQRAIAAPRHERAWPDSVLQHRMMDAVRNCGDNTFDLESLVECNGISQPDCETYKSE